MMVKMATTVCEREIGVGAISKSNFVQVQNVYRQRNSFIWEKWKYIYTHPLIYIQWNPDFSNLLGKRKLARKIEGDRKSRSIYEVLCYNNQEIKQNHLVHNKQHLQESQA